MTAAVKQTTEDLSKLDKLEKTEQVEKTSFLSFLLGMMKEIVEFKGWDPIFKVLLYGFLLWALYNLKKVYIFHTSEEWTQVPKNSLYDFKLALIALAFFVGYKHFCQLIFYNWLKNSLDLSKAVTEEEKQKKIEVACNWFGSMIYYVISSFSAYFLFRNQYFFPKALGGNGENSDMFLNFPYVQEIPYAIPFYMIQFASHLHTLIDYSLYKLKDAKAWDMFLHHCMAVFLIFFSYLLNNVPVGIMVLYVHDPCDIFVYLNRFVSALKGTSMALKATCYFGFVSSWMFFRLYAYPRVIISATLDFVSSTSNEILYSPVLFLVVMLTALAVLHCYWFMFIIRILLVMVKGKSDYNVYDKSKQKKAE